MLDRASIRHQRVMNSQEFHYYPFAVKSDKCVGSCNTVNEFQTKLSMFNMITLINE